MLTNLERFSGIGYAARGVPSAYVWSGTDQYVSGKYVRDGVYDPDKVTTGTRYRIVLTRQGSAVLGYVNGKDEYSATISGTQTLQEFAVGNTKGVTDAASQPFGTIRKAVLVSAKLYDTDFSS